MREKLSQLPVVLVVGLLLVLAWNTWGLTDVVSELNREVTSLSDSGARKQGGLRLAVERVEEGRLLLEAGQLDSAHAAFLSALERDPTSIEAHNQIEAVIVLGAVREPDRYLRDAERARYFATRFQVAPTATVSAADASVALGNLALFADNDIARAKAYYEEAASLQSTNLNAMIGQTLVSLLTNPTTPTIKLTDLVAAAEGVRLSPLACETIAKLAISSREAGVAVTFAMQGAGLRRSPRSLEVLARAHLLHGNTREAYEAATDLSLIAPREPTAFQILCQLGLKSEKNRAAAISPCSAAYQRTRELPDQVAMARALSAGGRDREAAEAYREVLRRDDQQAVVYLELSDVLQRMGDIRGAAGALSQVADIEESPGTTLPEDIVSLRDTARQKLSALGPVPPAPGASPTAGKRR